MSSHQRQDMLQIAKGLLMKDFGPSNKEHGDILQKSSSLEKLNSSRRRQAIGPMRC